jgi:hypothetical protein
LLQGHDLGVVSIFVDVGSFADDFRSAIREGADEDAAYLGVGRSEACGFGGKLERFPHESFVLGLFRVGLHHFQDNGFDESLVQVLQLRPCQSEP